MVQSMPYLAIPLDARYARDDVAFGYLLDYHPLALFEGVHFYAGATQETLEGQESCYYIVMQHKQVDRLRRLQAYLSHRMVMQSIALKGRASSRQYLEAQPLEFAGVLRHGRVENGNAALIAAMTRYKEPYAEEDISEEALRRAQALREKQRAEAAERREGERRQALEEARKWRAENPPTQEAPPKPRKEMPETTKINLPGFVSDIDVLLMEDEQNMPTDTTDTVLVRDRPLSALFDNRPQIPSDQGAPATSLANITPAPEIDSFSLDEAEKMGVDPAYALDSALLAMARQETEDIPEDTSAATHAGIVPTSTEREAPMLPEDDSSDTPLEIFGETQGDVEDLGEISMPEHMPEEAEESREGVIRLDSPYEPAMEIAPNTIMGAEQLVPKPVFEQKRHISGRALGIGISLALLAAIVFGYIFGDYYFARLREERRAIGNRDIQTIATSLLFGQGMNNMHIRRAEVVSADTFAESFTAIIRIASNVPSKAYQQEVTEHYKGQEPLAFIRAFNSIASNDEDPVWQEELSLRAIWQEGGIRVQLTDDDRARLVAMKNNCAAAELAAKVEVFRQAGGPAALRDLLLPLPSANADSPDAVLGAANNTKAYTDWLAQWEADPATNIAREETLKPLLCSITSVGLETQGNVWLLTMKTMDPAWYFPLARERGELAQESFISECMAAVLEDQRQGELRTTDVKIVVNLSDIASSGLSGAPAATAYLQEYLRIAQVYL